MKRRGVVLLMAVVMIGMTASLLALMASHANLESQRTRMAIEDAQISALLSAGADFAAGAAKSGKYETHDLASPAGTIRLTWNNPTAAVRTCEIEAAFGSTRRSIMRTY